MFFSHVSNHRHHKILRDLFLFVCTILFFVRSWRFQKVRKSTYMHVEHISFSNTNSDFYDFSKACQLLLKCCYGSFLSDFVDLIFNFFRNWSLVY